MTSRFPRKTVWLLATTTALALLTTAVDGQINSGSTAPTIPPNAAALEGVPQVRIEVTQEAASRHVLNTEEATANQLIVRITDGRYYWTSRDDGPLVVSSAGEFTYLSAKAPGTYLRFRRLNDTLIYVEHVDTPLGSVTYWGELRVRLGR